MDNNPLSRRAFLRFGAAAMGTAAAAPLAATFDAAAPRVMLHAGLLLPHAQFRPLLSANLLDGLRLGFAGTIYQPQFVTRQVRAADAADAARSLLDAGVDVAAGMVATHALDAVQDVFAAAGATFVQMTAGETIDTANRPNIAVNSLQYAQSAYAAGAWAARSHGARGMLLASFYESGFDTLYAAKQGVESVGGTVAATVVTHVSPSSGGTSKAIAAIQEVQPDFVYAAYNGPHAASFMAAYHASGLQVPLVVSPFMLDDVAFGVEGVRSVCAWSDDIASAANRDFLAAFRGSAGRRADAFAVLGYETARWIAAGLDAAGMPSRLLSGLAAAQVASPRGVLAYDAAAQTLTSGLSLRTAGAVEASVIPVETLSAARAPEMRTGWITPYMTI